MNSTILFLFAVLTVANVPTFVTEMVPVIKGYHFYVPFIAYAIFNLVYRPYYSVTLVNANRLMRWTLGLVILTLASIGFYNNIIPDIAQVKSNAWFVMLMMSVLSIVHTREHIAALMRGCFAGAVIVAGSIFIEFATTFKFYEVFEGMHGRLGGLHKNPNTAGLVCVFAYYLGQFGQSTKHRIALAIIVGVAVLLTFSRSAMLLWFMAVTMSYWFGIYGKVRMEFVLPVIGVFSLLVVLLVSGMVPVILQSIGGDHFSDYQLARVSSGFLNQEDESVAGRMDRIKVSLEVFSTHPLMGVGVGRSLASDPFELGPHNMFLRFMIELGTVGLLYFLLLIVIMAKNKETYGFALLFFTSCMFNHTTFDYAFYAVFIPLGLVLLIPEKIVTLYRPTNHVLATNPHLNPLITEKKARRFIAKRKIKVINELKDIIVD